VTILWLTVPLWQFQRTSDGYVVKISHTAVEATIQGVYQDPNVKIEVYGTENRLIGYALRSRKAGKRPLHLVKPSYLGLFYSDLRDLEKEDTMKPVSVVYHDANVRLLSFGTEPKTRDYLMVLRRQERDHE
jgi:uncharacterized Fe-S cluster-containing radical SAM superfamily enzyme